MNNTAAQLSGLGFSRFIDADWGTITKDPAITTTDVLDTIKTISINSNTTEPNYSIQNINPNADPNQAGFNYKPILIGGGILALAGAAYYAFKPRK